MSLCRHSNWHGPAAKRLITALFTGTLEELDQVFSLPSAVFVRYQVTKALPYFFKRHIFRQNVAPLQPLYQLDRELVSKQ